MGELIYESHRRLTKKKPGPTARARAKRRRKEAPVAAKVRAKCVERDGYCRLMGVSHCDGPSQWMHLEEKKRARTRGMKPEERHTTTHSMMGCERHHGLYDRGLLRIMLGAQGADGVLVVGYRGRVRSV